jgi:hypothetical protein
MEWNNAGAARKFPVSFAVIFLTWPPNLNYEVYNSPLTSGDTSTQDIVQCTTRVFGLIRLLIIPHCIYFQVIGTANIHPTLSESVVTSDHQYPGLRKQR